MKKILLLGLLLTSACDENSNSGNNTTKTSGAGAADGSVEFYLQNEAARNAKLDVCTGRYAPVPKEMPPECHNALEASARDQISGLVSGAPTIEAFLKSIPALEIARKYCIHHKFYTDFLTELQRSKTIPLEDPICQNVILAMEQLNQQCIREGNSPVVCRTLKEDLETIRNYKK